MVGSPTIGFAGTKAAFNPHSQRPPQTPAASFKSPYRKRLGSQRTSSPRLSSAEAFPIKASDFSSKWIVSQVPTTLEHSKEPSQRHVRVVA
jgi:hypothetical protein